jgi:hypothetical protein
MSNFLVTCRGHPAQDRGDRATSSTAFVEPLAAPLYR